MTRDDFLDVVGGVITAGALGGLGSVIGGGIGKAVYVKPAMDTLTALIASTEAGAGTLTITAEGAAMEAAYAEIASLKILGAEAGVVSAEITATAVATGAMAGAAAGTIVGGLVGQGVKRLTGSTTAGVVSGAVTGAITGAVVGGLIGGPIGAAVGGVLGGIGGAIASWF